MTTTITRRRWIFVIISNLISCVCTVVVFQQIIIGRNNNNSNNISRRRKLEEHNIIWLMKNDEKNDCCQCSFLAPPLTTTSFPTPVPPTPIPFFINFPSILRRPSSSPSLSNSPSQSPPSTTTVSSMAPSKLFPSVLPTRIPFNRPSLVPSSNNLPSIRPSTIPTISNIPSVKPSTMPSISAMPSKHPSMPPSLSIIPTTSKIPSVKPSTMPSISAMPSIQPSPSPSVSIVPSISNLPSVKPSLSTSPSTSSSPSMTIFNTSLDVFYTTPDSEDWPDVETWNAELGSRLSTDASLFHNYNKHTSSDNDYDYDYDDKCDGDVWEGLDFIRRADPICMIDGDCRYQFCNRNDEEVLNIPAYSVQVRTLADIIAALEFANQYNIPVSMKTTGHSFTGSSILKDSLNLWMSNYEFQEEIYDSFMDSCGTNYNATVSIGGGAVLDDVFAVVKNQYTLLSSDSRSVGFAGWLQGSALSHLSRYYGLGLDNVVSFTDVVLSSGEILPKVDACSHPDLFRALRGGGGGTFGVVTQMQYQLYETTKITVFEFQMDPPYWNRYYRQFLEFWLSITPTLDHRVAGAWFGQWHFEVYIVGSIDDAWELFGGDFLTWYSTTFTGNGDWEIEEFDSWYGLIVGEDEDAIQGFYDSNLQSRGHGPEVSSRLIPHDLVVNQRREVVDFLVDLADVEDWGAYWLGGRVNEIIPNGKTSVHPSLRESIYSITTSTDEGARQLRAFFPNTGPSFNHHSANEPSWRTTLWGGDQQYEQLWRVKQKYDPQNRFTCYHCVGYQGPEYEYN